MKRPHPQIKNMGEHRDRTFIISHSDNGNTSCTVVEGIVMAGRGDADFIHDFVDKMKKKHGNDVKFDCTCLERYDAPLP